MKTVPNYTDLLGKQFEYGGRGPERFDCFGLATELYRRAGVDLPGWASSDDPQVQAAGWSTGMNLFFDQVQQPQPLDLVLFQIMPRYITHCGICVGHGRFIHIMSRISVAVEELASPVWQGKQRGFYRFKGLTHG